MQLFAGSATNITLANSQNNVSYQLRIGTDAIGDPVVGDNGNTLSFPTGNLTETTEFNILATTIVGSDCFIVLDNTARVLVEQTPIAGTLAKTPNSANICEGTPVSAELTAGIGGSGDELEYRYDGDGAWNAYTSTNAIATIGHSLVEVRTRRIADACVAPRLYNSKLDNRATPIAGTLAKTPNTASCMLRR